VREDSLGRQAWDNRATVSPSDLVSLETKTRMRSRIGREPGVQSEGTDSHIWGTPAHVHLSVHAAETCLSTRYLPHRIAIQMKSQTPADLSVFNLIFNLSARDGEIAGNAEGARSITGADLVRHYYRQHAGLDARADSQP
jgi:hypothetical protein